MSSNDKIKSLFNWCINQTKNYKNVKITNFTSSWRDGLGFCAILHQYGPEFIDYNSLKSEDVLRNCQLAFDVGENCFGIPALLDARDMVIMPVPDRLSIITYLFQFYSSLSSKKPKSLSNFGNTLSSIENITDVVMTEITKPPNSDIPVAPRKEPTCDICSEVIYFLEKLTVYDKHYHRSCYRQNQLSNLKKRNNTIERQRAVKDGSLETENTNKVLRLNSPPPKENHEKTTIITETVINKDKANVGHGNSIPDKASEMSFEKKVKEREEEVKKDNARANINLRLSGIMGTVSLDKDPPKADFVFPDNKIPEKILKTTGVFETKGNIDENEKRKDIARDNVKGILLKLKSTPSIVNEPTKAEDFVKDENIKGFEIQENKHFSKDDVSKDVARSNITGLLSKLKSTQSMVIDRPKSGAIIKGEDTISNVKPNFPPLPEPRSSEIKSTQPHDASTTSSTTVVRPALKSTTSLYSPLHKPDFPRKDNISGDGKKEQSEKVAEKPDVRINKPEDYRSVLRNSHSFQNETSKSYLERKNAITKQKNMYVLPKTEEDPLDKSVPVVNSDVELKGDDASLDVKVASAKVRLNIPGKDDTSKGDIDDIRRRLTPIQNLPTPKLESQNESIQVINITTGSKATHCLIGEKNVVVSGKSEADIHVADISSDKHKLCHGEEENKSKNEMKPFPSRNFEIKADSNPEPNFPPLSEPKSSKIKSAQPQNELNIESTTSSATIVRPAITSATSYSPLHKPDFSRKEQLEKVAEKPGTRINKPEDYLSVLRNSHSFQNDTSKSYLERKNDLGRQKNMHVLPTTEEGSPEKSVPVVKLGVNSDVEMKGDDSSSDVKVATAEVRLNILWKDTTGKGDIEMKDDDKKSVQKLPSVILVSQNERIQTMNITTGSMATNSLIGDKNVIISGKSEAVIDVGNKHKLHHDEEENKFKNEKKLFPSHTFEKKPDLNPERNDPYLKIDNINKLPKLKLDVNMDDNGKASGLEFNHKEKPVPYHNARDYSYITTVPSNVSDIHPSDINSSVALGPPLSTVDDERVKTPPVRPRRLPPSHLKECDKGSKSENNITNESTANPPTIVDNLPQRPALKPKENDRLPKCPSGTQLGKEASNVNAGELEESTVSTPEDVASTETSFVVNHVYDSHVIIDRYKDSEVLIDNSTFHRDSKGIDSEYCTFSEINRTKPVVELEPTCVNSETPAAEVPQPKPIPHKRSKLPKEKSKSTDALNVYVTFDLINDDTPAEPPAEWPLSFSPPPTRSVPTRPPPPKIAPPRPLPGKREVRGTKFIPYETIYTELQELNEKQSDLEKKGRPIQKSLKKLNETDEGYDGFMQEWLEIVGQKNGLFKREHDLHDTLKQQELEDRHSELEYEYRVLSSKQESLKSASEKAREEELLQQIVKTVNARAKLVDDEADSSERSSIDEFPRKKKSVTHFFQKTFRSGSLTGTINPWKKPDKKPSKKSVFYTEH